MRAAIEAWTDVASTSIKRFTPIHHTNPLARFDFANKRPQTKHSSGGRSLIFRSPECLSPTVGASRGQTNHVTRGATTEGANEMAKKRKVAKKTAKKSTKKKATKKKAAKKSPKKRSKAAGAKKS